MIQKRFVVEGWFDGEVYGVIGNDIFRVRHTDGDTEEFRLETLQKHTHHSVLKIS